MSVVSSKLCDDAQTLALLADVPLEGEPVLGLSGSARGRIRTGMEFPPRDFRTRYSFRCCAPDARIWGLDFIFAMPPHTCSAGGLGRGRQVSTLSPPLSRPRLARYCSHPDVLLFHRI